MAEGTFLIFRVLEDFYAVDALSVLEIRQPEKLTPLPTVPDFVKGVLNVRGKVIPIINFQRRLFGSESDPTLETVVILLARANEKNVRSTGFIVDAVIDVIDIDTDLLALTPIANGELDRMSIGIYESESHFISVLDVDKMLILGESDRADSDSTAGKIA